jgi:hypothetical protein
MFMIVLNNYDFSTGVFVGEKKSKNLIEFSVFFKKSPQREGTSSSWRLGSERITGEEGGILLFDDVRLVKTGRSTSSLFT